MATSLIVLALDDDVDREVQKQAGGAARRFVPVAGPPGEYPDADPGPVRSVWIVSPPSEELLSIVADAGERAEAYRVDSALQWDEPDGDSSLPLTPTRLAFINALETLDKAGFVEK